MSEVRPMRPDEYEAFLERSRRTYAEDMVRAGISVEAAKTKSERDHLALLPDGVETKDHYLYTVEDDGVPAGFLWLADRPGEFGRNFFVYGIEIGESHRGRGLGRAAMEFAEEEARRLGIPKIALNVFGGNDVAHALYRSLGYLDTAIYMEKSL
ncbi:MAG TPA: GNAT family N-acetyltransferase [Gaiellaceae bacterium]